LVAMWGAPQAQPDNAALACRAALDMRALLPQLNERWQPLLGELTDLSIGINTGQARVGNTGTPRKFKYGPLGNAVNLARRGQGGPKHLKSRLLITGAPRAQLDASFAVRRLGRARVLNIREPVELFELAPPGQAGWADMQAEYEKALAMFERKSF